MNLLNTLQVSIVDAITTLGEIDRTMRNRIEVTLNIDKEPSFGDLSCNAAMILAKHFKKKPRELADAIQALISSNDALASYIEKTEIAGPGFLNIFLRPTTWGAIATEVHEKKADAFTTNTVAKKYLIEFVSANPTGPLHLGHGRGGIIGDVLANILSFLGHDVAREFYINDAGNQIQKLGMSFKLRCKQAAGTDVPLPEDAYHGDYLTTLAHDYVKKHGTALLSSSEHEFAAVAQKHLLTMIESDLAGYGITFNTWFSETTLHESGAVTRAIENLKHLGLVYEDGGALWFKSTKFGDDKDRVIQKQDGTLTYIAADIAYHKHKFSRADILVDILGQDHHGYVRRLKATMEALGEKSDHLRVILYQLVSIKHGNAAVKMSKRAGTFTTLRDIIDAVGVDVARFFYLNRKADAHLDFDLETALKTTDENPAYYIQYAYVRTKSVLEKAASLNLTPNPRLEACNGEETMLLRKILQLQSILATCEQSLQTHMLAFYTHELASAFHSFYARNRIIDIDNTVQSRGRLLVVDITRTTLQLCLDLLGISKPEKM